MEEITIPVPTLLAEVADERASARRRETFLLSVIVHLLGIIVVVTTPEWFQWRPTPVEPKQEQVTMLYEPPRERPQLTAPPIPEPRQEAPRPQPRLEEPSLRLGARPFVPPPPGDPESRELKLGQGEEEKELLARQAPEIGLPDFPESSEEPSGQRPTLEPVAPEPKPSPSQAQLSFPTIAPPTRGTDAILRGMARDRASGAKQGFGDDFPEFDSEEQPDLNIPGPQILSDTMGVDFQPYLLRVYLLVRRNWYSVIPEIARLGKQGRVALEFSILRDGSVPDLTLTVGSGTSSLDSAALASIRLSNPFPALPSEFPGDHIRLRFIYLYNIRVNF